MIALLSLLLVAFDDPVPEPGEELAGGETTVFEETTRAFSLPARNLRGARRRHFAVGSAFFDDAWVIAPASTAGRDGLGPLFNARSCSACHPADGRGTPLEERVVMFEPAEALIVRLGVPGAGPHGEPLPEPRYGGQLQTLAIPGARPEGALRLRFDGRLERYPDGTPYRLTAPKFEITELAYGELAEDVLISPRVAPPVFGLGLLELVPEEDLLARADPDDADGDGISGRANRVWDVAAEAHALGRFGWKAGQPTLEQQVANALVEDIGITSPLFPIDRTTEAQTRARALANGGEPELDAHKLERLSLYVRMLAPPARRGWDDVQVLRGRDLFRRIGCADCHVPSWTTGESEEYPELSGQRIWPYTDLLLHDMGPELADHRPEFEASGSEWRTPPLWGIGLTRRINPRGRYLHDGRAWDIEQAILWHGGEAQAARDAFAASTAEERAALFAFLGSL